MSHNQEEMLINELMKRKSGNAVDQLKKMVNQNFVKFPKILGRIMSEIKELKDGHTAKGSCVLTRDVSKMPEPDLIDVQVETLYKLHEDGEWYFTLHSTLPKYKNWLNAHKFSLSCFEQLIVIEKKLSK